MHSIARVFPPEDSQLVDDFDIVPADGSGNMPADDSDIVPADVSGNMPEDDLGIASAEVFANIFKDDLAISPEDLPEDAPEDVSENSSENPVFEQRELTNSQVSRNLGRYSPDSFGNVLTLEEEVELFQLIEKGDRKALEIMIIKNMGLVGKVVKPFLSVGIPFEVLEQEGSFGVFQATKTYDYRRGYKFSTYATWWIRKAVIKYIRDFGGHIRIPSGIQGVYLKFCRFSQKFFTREGRYPNEEETIAELGISEEKAKLFVSDGLFCKIVYWDKFLGSGKGGTDTSRTLTLADIIGEEDCEYDFCEEEAVRLRFFENFKEIFLRGFLRMKKEKAEEKGRGKAKGRDYEKDTERAWDIFINRFGFTENSMEMTLEALGERYSVSKERIRQIEGQVLDFIKTHPALLEQLEQLKSSTE